MYTFAVPYSPHSTKKQKEPRMKNTLKIIARIVLTVMVTAMFAACAGNSNVIAQPVPDEGAEMYEITGTCTVERIDDTTVKVHCTTNLMDGAVVAISLDSYTGENIAEKKYTKQSEGFYHEFTIDKDIEGEIYASLVCMPSSHGKQPTEIKNAYGAQFQNIEGECVIWNPEGNCVVIMSEPFEL